MNSSDTLTRIQQTGVVAVIRGEKPAVLLDVSRALVAGGVDCVEITFTVPNAIDVLKTVAAELGDEAVVGAGTVLDPETARAAILAGARFVVSPITCVQTIELCRRYSVAVMPGAMTPTEVVAAWQAGADVVKIFPSDVTGPRYIKALKGPLPQIRMMPTGGVTLENAVDFLKSGAFAVGAGGSLVEKQAVANGDTKRIEKRANEFVKAVESYKNARQ